MNTPPILPADHYMASMLGLTADEYRWFKLEAYKRVKIEPGTPVAGVETLAILSLVFTVISVGLAIAASFFKPKERKAGEIKSSTEDPENVTRNQRFAPRYGFNSTQKPAVLGTTIPVVYANRVALGDSTAPPRPAGTYGGVRINLQLLWSQMLSLGGDQFLRALFAVSEATALSLESIAIGDNTVGAYDFVDSTAMQQAGKLTIYYRPGGGRIKGTDYLLGRIPALDPGNAVPLGAIDVYQVKSTGQVMRPDFCFCATPASGTVFGLTSWLPNGMFYRVNPQLAPTGSIEKISKSKGERFRVEWTDDFNAVAGMWKAKYQWSRRCGVVGDSRYYNVNEQFVYILYRNSDADTVIIVNGGNAKGSTGPDANTAELSCKDIASTIASYQNGIAESLVPGELYKFGSALAVLVNSSPDNAIFISDSENDPPGGGQTITYTFRVVRGGYIANGGENINPNWSGSNTTPPEWRYYEGDGRDELEALPIPTTWDTVSNRPQGFLCTLADIRVTRSCTIFEVGLRSTVGIRISGFSNLKDCLDYNLINDRSGGKYINDEYDSEQNLGFQAHSSGAISLAEYRYSFFKIYIKKDSESNYTEIPGSFGVRSNTSQPVYNYLRFEMTVKAEWQIRFEPIASWEIRHNSAQAPFAVIDYQYGAETSLYRSVQGGVLISWTGYTISNTKDSFKIQSVEPSNSRGLGWSDISESCMTDPWGRVAEAFCYDALETTISQGPEHEVVYINTISTNTVTPTYNQLATLGLNIRASKQWTQLSQVSAYVTQGREVQRLLNNNSAGPSNLFPDILRDLLLSVVFGMGDSITSDQIDTQSFIDAAQWCQTRRYFFDGVIASKTNLRQWAADTAASMLLDLLQRDGRFALEPAIIFPEDGPVPIRAIFTAGNIVEDSFSLEFLNEEDRLPIQASVKWREERSRDNYSSPGLFPVEREVLVRETSSTESDPIESFDLSDYCTNLEHAIDFACFVIRMRKTITHTIKLSTTPDGLDSSLRAGDYIKVALDFTYYDEFANGVILADGTIVSTRPDLLPPGTHDAVYWDGGDNPVVDGPITVSADGLGSPPNVVFIKKNVNTQVRTYKVESISLSENGVIDIEAVHHPVDSSGVSLIGKNWTTYSTDSSWIISKA